MLCVCCVCCEVLQQIHSAAFNGQLDPEDGLVFVQYSTLHFVLPPSADATRTFNVDFSNFSSGAKYTLIALTAE